MAATLLSHFYRNAKIRNRKFFTKGCIKITHWWFLWQDKNRKALSNSLMELWTRWCFLETSVCCAVGLEGNTFPGRSPCVLKAMVCLCQLVKQPGQGRSTWQTKTLMTPFNYLSVLSTYHPADHHNSHRGYIITSFKTFKILKLIYAREHGWNLFHVSEIKELFIDQGVVYTFNSCTWEAEAGESLGVWGQLGLFGLRTSRVTERNPVSK